MTKQATYTMKHFKAFALDMANQMIEAADGFADDETVIFRGHKYSAGYLRETADEAIDSLMGIA